jgi:hypothetical protein
VAFYGLRDCFRTPIGRLWWPKRRKPRLLMCCKKLIQGHCLCVPWRAGPQSSFASFVWLDSVLVGPKWLVRCFIQVQNFMTGLAVAGPFSDLLAVRATRRNGGIREPEMRLLVVMTVRRDLAYRNSRKTNRSDRLLALAIRRNGHGK